MAKNLGALDRILRTVIGIGLLYLAWIYFNSSFVISGILLVLGILTIVTAITGFCAVYKLLNISTYKNKYPQDNTPVNF